MKTLLINPPGLFSNETPPYGIGLLTSYLQERGFNCEAWDLNTEFCQYYYSKQIKTSDIKKIKADMAILNKKQTNFSKKEAEIYYKLQTRLNYYETAQNPPLYFYLNFSKFTYPHDFNDFLNIWEKNPGKLFHYNYLKNHFLKKALSYKADIYGFSISVLEQLYPALILASLIREKQPKSKFILGGSTVFFIPQDIKNILLSKKYVDFMVQLQGEKAFIMLLQALKNKTAYEKIPNLFYFSKNKIVSNPLAPPEDINNLPIPNYNQFDLNLYSNTNYFSTLLHRGCYWNKCVFCEVRYLNLATCTKPKMRNLDMLIKEIKYLIKNHNAHTIWLLSEAVPAAHIKKVTKRIIKEKIKANFMIFMRAGAAWDLDTCKLMKKAGVELVRIGIENFSGRLLKLMNKGNTYQEIITTINNLQKAGIGIRMSLIFDFPTITKKELDFNLKEVLKHKKQIDFLNVFKISVSKYSLLAKTPAKFGLQLLSQEPLLSEGVTSTSLGFQRIKGEKNEALINEYFQKFLDIRDRIIPTEVNKKRQKWLKNLTQKNARKYWLCIKDGTQVITTTCQMEQKNCPVKTYYYLFSFGDKMYTEINENEYIIAKNLLKNKIIKLAELKFPFNFSILKKLLQKMLAANLISGFWLKDIHT
ncbi:B12-binding domain-containing radical SAM protein [Candidatus Margulisiibacteriota bacterium]